MQLYQAIKDDILNNQLPVGRPLRQAELSERYGVSRIPIRDVLAQLRAEGWLIPHGKAGNMIPDLNWQEAEDLYLMRADLEPRLLRHAFEHLRPTDFKFAQKTLLQLEQANLTLLEKGELNWDFHKILYEPANRPTLFKIVQSLNLQAIRYLGFQYGPMGYQQHSQNEHTEILELLRNGSLSSAMDLLEKHIKQAGQLLVTYLQSIE